MLTNSQPMIARVRWPIAFAFCLTFHFSLIPAAALAQSLSSNSTATDEKAPLKTPLGTQVAHEKAAPLLRALANPEPANDVLQRTGTALTSQLLSNKDMVGEGTVTVYTAVGPATFAVTLVQNGERGSQRILLKQPDGKLWDGKAEHLASGGRQALEFLEAQHARGVRQLLDSPKRNATIADNGIKNASHILTVRETNGDATQYVLDDATSRLTGFQFVRGQSRDSAGNVSPILHWYALADVRSADGVATPFHIEHVVDGVKQEELQLTKVRYNTTATSAPVIRPASK